MSATQRYAANTLSSSSIRHWERLRVMARWSAAGHQRYTHDIGIVT